MGEQELLLRSDNLAKSQVQIWSPMEWRQKIQSCYAIVEGKRKERPYFFLTYKEGKVKKQSAERRETEWPYTYVESETLETYRHSGSFSSACWEGGGRDGRRRPRRRVGDRRLRCSSPACRHVADDRTLTCGAALLSGRFVSEGISTDRCVGRAGAGAQTWPERRSQRGGTTAVVCYARFQQY